MGKKLVAVKAMHPWGLNTWSHIGNSLGLFYWIRSVLGEISPSNAIGQECPASDYSLNVSEGAYV